MVFLESNLYCSNPHYNDTMVITMPKCPKCGFEVKTPIKKWRMKYVVIGLYRCPNGHYFRAKAEP